jgi:hypothetical protein
MGGYAFALADSQNMSPQLPGTSTATLASDGSLCISGNVMALPANPTAADYSNDWGCGIGVNVNQMMGTNMPINSTTLSGTGVSVTVNAIPTCTTARVIVTDSGTDYCAPLTGTSTTVPWSMFNTECWMPSKGQALSGAPTAVTAVKVQFVTSMTACTFSNFCIDAMTL